MTKKSTEADVKQGTPQTRSPSYRLSFEDDDFMMRDELRPVRLQLELLKPELVQQDHGICSTIVIFGGTRIKEPVVAAAKLAEVQAKLDKEPDSQDLKRELAVAQRVQAKAHYYDQARQLAKMITLDSQRKDGDSPRKDEGSQCQDGSSQYKDGGTCEMVVVTGGGPGLMEAANRGADDAGGKSIGLNIVLPREQTPNRYITPELTFQFHYFAVRKMHFLMRARALVAFPGGFGTLDELFETLTLIQTKKIKPVPVLLFGSQYWRRIINFEALADEGTIDHCDLALFKYVDSVDEAWACIHDFYAKAGQASQA